MSNKTRPNTDLMSLSKETIDAAKKSTLYSKEQLDYMYKTRNSMDRNDVAWHRGVTLEVNPSGSERNHNNYRMHPNDPKYPYPGQWKKW